MFGDAATDFDNRCLLKCVESDIGSRYLSGDRDDGDAVQFCIRQAGDQICRARTAGCHADPRLAGRSSVSLGGKRTALLMARQNRANAVLVSSQRLVQRHTGTTRIGENDLNVMVHQRLHENVGTIHELIVSRCFGSGHGLCSGNFGKRGRQRNCWQQLTLGDETVPFKR